MGSEDLVYSTCEACHEACAECLDNDASKTNPGGVKGYGECCGKACGAGYYRFTFTEPNLTTIKQEPPEYGQISKIVPSKYGGGLII